MRFISVICGVATVLTCILILETGKDAKKTLEKRKRKHVRQKNRS